MFSALLFLYREEEVEEDFEDQEEVDELDASSFQEPVASEEEQQPPESESLASEQEQQPPESDDKLTQPNKISRSVMTQTGEIEKLSKPSVPKHIPAYGPHQKFVRGDEEYQYQEELGLIKGTKVSCSLDLLIQQLKGSCRHPGCIHDTAVDYTLCGTSAMIRCKCPADHIWRFCTSGEVNNVLSNNFQAAAALLLSGNNFAKVEKLFGAIIYLCFNLLEGAEVVLHTCY